MKSIRDHVDPDHKKDCQNWDLNPSRMSLIERNEKTTIYINESRLYSLIFHSKLESG